MGIRETRKKLQRTVEYITYSSESREVALRELLLLKQTLDASIESLQPVRVVDSMVDVVSDAIQEDWADPAVPATIPRAWKGNQPQGENREHA
ncbi:MAG: hypothetical protein NTW96_24640 [Planctomycetia bacterium]|nr:hypothetical protein [Planctomycetia bacterium]